MTDAGEAAAAAVFLDRDGTIMRDVDYCGNPADVAVFEGVGDALLRLKRGGFKVIVITNQSGIGRGYFGEKEYRVVEREVERQLGNGAVDATYFCADLPDSASARRKPEPGMIWEAQREHNLDLRRSFFIGDKATDIDCGKNAGLRTILVETGYGKNATDCEPDHIVRDVIEAAEIILTECNG